MATSFADVFDSVVKGLKDRVANPFSAAFILSWCATNYQRVLLTFSDLPFPEKVKFIEENLAHNSVSDWMWFNAVVPGFFAFIYVFFYPWVAIAAKWWTRNADNAWKAARLKLDNTRVIDGAEAKDLLAHVAKVEAQLAAAVEQHRKERGRDQTAIATLSKAQEAWEVEHKRFQLRIEALVEESPKAKLVWHPDDDDRHRVSTTFQAMNVRHAEMLLAADEFIKRDVGPLRIADLSEVQADTVRELQSMGGLRIDNHQGREFISTTSLSEDVIAAVRVRPNVGRFLILPELEESRGSDGEPLIQF